MMRRTIQILTLLILTITLVGCIFIPNNSMFWLATSSMPYTIVRAILIFVIYSFLLFGTPPDKKVKRVVGLLAGALLGWALVTTYQETTAFLDGLTFAAAGVSLILNILEPDYGSQGEENWEIISSKVRPHTAFIGKQAAYYAIVAFMLFDLYGRNLQSTHGLHNIRNLLS